jgi:hypothetical protein
VDASCTQDSTLQSIQFSCVLLATKMLSNTPGCGMLRFMLSQLYGREVSAAQAAEVEAKCLQGLGWRLGPFFVDNDLEEVFDV